MQEPRSTLPALFALGFRPLFLAGALFAVLAVPLWIAAFLGHIEFTPAGGSLGWHRHEMVFGFGMAIVAGFLLTAIQAWTGVPTISGLPVLLLAALWLAGRLVWLLNAPLWLLVPVDLLFLPLVALVIGRLLFKVRQTRNYPVLVMLVLLTLCNLLALLGLAQDDFALQRHGSVAALWLIAGLMGLIGGRVIPFFTQRGLDLREQTAALPRLDNLLMAGSVFVARSEEHTSELQSRPHLVCRLLLEKKNKNTREINTALCFTLLPYALAHYSFSVLRTYNQTPIKSL